MLGASRDDVSSLKSVILVQTKPGSVLGLYQEVQKKTPRESLIGSLVPTLIHKTHPVVTEYHVHRVSSQNLEQNVGLWE